MDGVLTDFVGLFASNSHLFGDDIYRARLDDVATFCGLKRHFPISALLQRYEGVWEESVLSVAGECWVTFNSAQWACRFLETPQSKALAEALSTFFAEENAALEQANRLVVFKLPSPDEDGK